MNYNVNAAQRIYIKIVESQEKKESGQTILNKNYKMKRGQDLHFRVLFFIFFTERELIGKTHSSFFPQKIKNG